MEIVGVLAAGLFVIWLIAKAMQRSASAGPKRAAPVGASSSVAPTPRSSPKPTPAATAAETWAPPGDSRTVAGYEIAGGMLYLGKHLAAINRGGVEPALIDPSLEVRRSNPDRAGTGMRYWPSYNTIPPECRAGYLKWLAGGRREPDAYIGYVFLYFYGLERRVFAEAPNTQQARDELPVIAAEVKELLNVYGSSRSFRRYATQLLDVVGMLLVSDAEVVPPMERVGFELPASLRVAVGRMVAQGKPVPADWALSWFLTHPESPVRTPAERCPAEFGALFRIRYRREYGDGLVLKAGQSRLKVSLTPASASFGGRVDLTTDVPDIAPLTGAISKLRKIGDGCTADLDAFSRWVGRNADAPRTIAAVALLPPELAKIAESDEARGFWQWVETAIGAQDRTLCLTDDLLKHCMSFGAGKLAKAEAVLLAQLLEKGGYGIEPDVRFGGTPISPGGSAVLFRLPSDAVAIASHQYAAASVLLHLAVAVSSADGTVSPSEREHLERHVKHALGLSASEALRLSAHLEWLVKSPPSLTGLKKRLEPLEQRQRSAIADFIIGVAGADGEISPDEIRTLGKVYPMLGLQTDDVYGRVHAMTAKAGSSAAATEPVTVLPAESSTGTTIPPRPGASQTVRLDMVAVQAKLAESSKISAILDDIFADEEPANVPVPTSAQGPAPKVTAPYALLLSKLLGRPTWSRVEFEALAAECRLLPDGAIDTLNEASFEHRGSPLLEGDDPIHVDPDAKDLLT